MTVFAAYQTALQCLIANGCGPQEARAAARSLVDEVSQFAHAHLTHGEQVLNASQIARFEVAVRELESGRPLAYILGKRDWHRLSFHSDSRALVPRPETELLVEEALRRVRDRSTPDTMIADLGTGTGCIAISLAHELPHATIYATDASPTALSLAQENARTLVPESLTANHLRFLPGVRGEWAAPLLEYSGKFDLIVSNPPYIARAEIETLQREVRDHEPRLALDGGNDGLDCYRQLAGQCGVLLKPAGALLCELGAGQFEDVREIFETESWCVENPIFDFAGIARILAAHRQP